MGGKSTSDTSTTQQSQLSPYAPASEGLQGILSGLQPSVGNIQGTPFTNQAFSQLLSNAQAPNPFVAPVQSAALSLLGGPQNSEFTTNLLKNAYGNTAASLSPFTSGSALNPASNPALASQLQTVSQDVANQVNPMFAAAGRLNSPDNYQALARGITQGSAPILQNAAANQLGAISALQGAAGSTAGGLSALDQLRAGILGTGIQAAQPAYATQNLAPEQLLAVAQAQQQSPAQMAGLLSSIYSPIAAQFGQTNASGTSHTENQMSGIQQLLMGAQAFNSFLSPFRTPAAANPFPS
jgi:hypothetical protein